MTMKNNFLKDGGAKGQGELFFECGRHPDEKYIVVIHEGNVHILRPSGSVQFKKSSVLEDKDGYKAFTCRNFEKNADFRSARDSCKHWSE